jgi:hypothetical protein
MHFAGIGEFIFDAGGCTGLKKLAEASACVGETPGWDLDLKGIERCPDLLLFFVRHVSVPND